LSGRHLLSVSVNSSSLCLRFPLACISTFLASQTADEILAAFLIPPCITTLSNSLCINPTDYNQSDQVGTCAYATSTSAVLAWGAKVEHKIINERTLLW